MVNKIIIDDVNISLDESTVFPFTYNFTRSGVHNVKIGLENTNEICAYAFKNCDDLTKVEFPSMITTIKRNAFENCVKLKKIELPETIDYVGPNVFNGCTSLTEIQFTKKEDPETRVPPTIFFSDLAPTTFCYIPDGSKFVKVEDFDNIVTDGSVQYFTKNEIGGYDEIDYELLSDGGEYYYDQWNEVHDYSHVIEERFRVKPEEINFTYNGANMRSFETTYASTQDQVKQIYGFNILPQNTTNQKITYLSSNSDIVSIDQTGEMTFKANKSGNVIIYACTEPYYDGTYFSASLSLPFRKNASGLSMIEKNITIEIGSIYDITEWISNPNNLPLDGNLSIVATSNASWISINEAEHKITPASSRLGNVALSIQYKGTDLYAATFMDVMVTIIKGSKQESGISFNNAMPVSPVTLYKDEIDLAKIEINNPHSLPVTFISSNEDLVTVDNEGNLTFKDATGSATITVTFEGSENYNATILNYVINIQEPLPEEIPDIEIEFDTDNGEIQIINNDTEPEVEPEADPDIINEYEPDTNGDIQIINDN